MNFLAGSLISLSIGAIPLLCGTARQLPALPDGAKAVALQQDASGNIYVAGSIAPKVPRSTADTSDVFVAKVSPDGGKILYTRVLGGSSADAAVALAVGSDDSVYVTGTTSSNDFPVTPGAMQTAFGGELDDAFAAKLDPSGNIVYATYAGATYTFAEDIAIDGAGDAFILGSGGLPPGVPGIAGGDTQNLAGWVMEIDPTGSKLLMGFAGLGGQHIAVDGEGNVYLAGLAKGLIAPPFTPGAFQTSQANAECGGDAFLGFACFYEYVAKADPTGTKLIYLTGLNGTYGAIPAGIAVDASGNAMVAGTTNSPDFPITSEAFESLYGPIIPSPTVTSTFKGGDYISPPATGFVAKFNAAGSGLVWSTFFGGTNTDSISSMKIDSAGNVILAGLAGSSDLPGILSAPSGCGPSLIQTLSFAVRLTPDGTSASPAQLFYGSPNYLFGPYNLITPSGPIAIAGSASGELVGLQQAGAIFAADLFAPSRLACVADPADNVQLLSVAPGQLLTLFGTMLAPSVEGPSGEPPTALNGVTVTFNGIAAPILYTSDNQVNVQVPHGIAGQTMVTMKIENSTTAVALDEALPLAVTQQQPSVFLTTEALAGIEPACSGTDGVAPTVVALNGDGSRNSAANPASAGSTVTIFLNGVAPGTAVTGLANDNPIPFTTGKASNDGAVPITFQIPSSYTNGVSLTKVQAGGDLVRERFFAVCVNPSI